jgi:hypothetical protein
MINSEYAQYQVFHSRCCYNLFLATKEVIKLTKATTVTELIGIKIAATIGESCPLTAKLRPTRL